MYMRQIQLGPVCGCWWVNVLLQSLKTRKHLDRSSIDAHVGVSHLTKNSTSCCLIHCATPTCTRRESTCFFFSTVRRCENRIAVRPGCLRRISAPPIAWRSADPQLSGPSHWKDGLGARSLQSSNSLSSYGRCSNILHTAWTSFQAMFAHLDR
jgi:hypothetical protein